MKLDERLAAVITGGASGLGEATARHLASFGVKVAIFDVEEMRGQEVAKEIDGIYCNVDVTDPQQLEAAFEFARKQHGIEKIFVSCAGIAPGQKTVSRGKPHDPDLFSKTLSINLFGTFVAASQSSAGMVLNDAEGDDEARGVIVMTSSVAGIEGQIGQSAYAASKAGVIGLTLPMARDLAKSGVRVVTIAPGLFETPMMKGLPEDVRTSLGQQIPFPARLAKPEEYASLVQQIVENDMLNGSVIRLDGAIRLQAN